MNIKKSLAALPVIAVLLITGCAQPTDPGPLVIKVAVTGVSLDKTSLSLKMGADAILVATVFPTDATLKTVTWSSSDAQVATVDSSGKVKATGGGSATITATSVNGSKKATCTVTVPVTVETLQSALQLLAAKLVVTQTEFDRNKPRAESLKALVDKVAAGMDDLNYVADSIVQLDEQMGTVETVATSLSPIPYVGPVAKVTKTAVEKVHAPIKTAADKIEEFRKPYITPARELIAKVKAKTDGIDAVLVAIHDNLEYARKVALAADERIATVTTASIQKEINGYIKELNEIIDDLNDGLHAVNDVMDKMEAGLKAVASGVSPMSVLRDGVETVMTPFNKIKGATDEISAALKKERSFLGIGYTIQGVLNKIDSVLSAIKEWALGVVDPLLTKLNVDLPSLPGLDKLDAPLAKAKVYYDTIASVAAKVDAAAALFANVPTTLKDRAETILAKVGGSL